MPLDMTFTPSVAANSPVWDYAQANADGGVSVTIDTNTSDYDVSPKPAHFQLTLTGFDTNTAGSTTVYDASYHDKRVYWDYGEGYTFTAPTQVIAADAADGGSRSNSQYSLGSLGAHLYRAVGTHTVRVAVYEPSSQKWGYATTTVSVTDIDTFFGTDTIYVHPSGDYTNSQAGWTNVTTLAAAFSAHNGSNTPTRIVLENGQTYPLTTSYIFRPIGSDDEILYLTARDIAGTRPIVSVSSIASDDAVITDRAKGNSTGKTGAVFRGVHFQGTWDTEAQTGEQAEFYRRFGESGSEGSKSAAFDRCSFDGFGKSLDLQNDVPGSLVTLNDSTITNWGNFGIMSQGLYGVDEISVVGSSISQNVDAVVGGPDNQQPVNNRHGPMRIAKAPFTALLCSDFLSTTGWSGGGGGISAAQPAIRQGSGLAGQSVPDGARSMYYGSTFESPYIVVQPGAQNDTTFSNSINMLAEKCIFLAGAQARCVISHTHSGITLRKCALVFTAGARNINTIGMTAYQPQAFLQCISDTLGTGHLDDPVIMEDCDLINLSNQAMVYGEYQNTSGEAAFVFSDVRLNRNITSQPNLGSPTGTHNPVVSNVLAGGRYKGVRTNNGTLYAQFAHTVNDLQHLTPQSGSSALNGSGDQIAGAADFAEDYEV
ncbi:hypothetical protein [Halocynthiibacter sp.]|uniref:hypothetical protein n=1 Tax=Halocynthiibacter sp. TaxID=1979210 RepID=UPI003C5A1F80